MSITPEWSNVYKIRDFHANPPPLIAMPSEDLDIKLIQLNEEQLQLLYSIGIGFCEAKFLEHRINKHRSTTIKYLSELEEIGLVQSRIKPGTENKYRPTKLYQLPSEFNFKDVERAATKKGLNLQDNTPDKIDQPEIELTPELQNLHFEASKTMTGGANESHQPETPSIPPTPAPKLPDLPTFDPNWSDETKAAWMKAYASLLEKIQ